MNLLQNKVEVSSRAGYNIYIDKSKDILSLTSVFNHEVSTASDGEICDMMTCNFTRNKGVLK